MLENEAVREQLAALRATGVRIGLSTSGTSQRATIERALELDLFDAVQATWNLYERSAEPALTAAASGRPDGLRQGGARQRPPGRARAGA